MLRAIGISLLLALGLYLLYAMLFFSLQRSVLFPRHLIGSPEPADNPTSAIEVMPLEMDFGVVEAWFLPPLRQEAGNPSPALIITHGNGELIDLWVELVDEPRRMGLAVLLVEYPGYGRSEGAPSETAIRATLVRAYDALASRADIDAARIVLFGRSLGGGAVAQLTTQRPSAALILLSTFTSVRDMAAPYRLPGRLVRDPFDTLAIVRDYPNPVLILHGAQDEVVPYAHAVRLHEAAPNSTLITLECGHNDCMLAPDPFWRQIEPFLESIGILQ